MARAVNDFYDPQPQARLQPASPKAAAKGSAAQARGAKRSAAAPRAGTAKRARKGGQPDALKPAGGKRQAAGARKVPGAGRQAQPAGQQSIAGFFAKTQSQPQPQVQPQPQTSSGAGADGAHGHVHAGHAEPSPSRATGLGADGASQHSQPGASQAAAAQTVALADATAGGGGKQLQSHGDLTGHAAQRGPAGSLYDDQVCLTAGLWPCCTRRAGCQSRTSWLRGTQRSGQSAGRCMSGHMHCLACAGTCMHCLQRTARESSMATTALSCVSHASGAVCRPTTWTLRMRCRPHAPAQGPSPLSPALRRQQRPRALSSRPSGQPLASPPCPSSRQACPCCPCAAL